MASAEEVQQLQEACRRAEEETASVRQKLRNAVKKGKAIEEERAELQRQLEELHAAPASHEAGPSTAELGALKANADDCKEKLKSAVKKGKAIEGECQALRDRVQELEAQLQAAGSCDGGQVESLQASVAEYKEKLKNAVRKGKSIEAERALQAEELQTTAEALQGTEQKAEALRQQLTVQQEALQAAAGRVAAAGKEAADEKLRADQACKERDRAFAKLSELADTESESSGALKHAHSLADALRFENAEIAAELGRVQQELEAVREGAASAHAELEESQAEARNLLAEAEAARLQSLETEALAESLKQQLADALEARQEGCGGDGEGGGPAADVRMEGLRADLSAAVQRADAAESTLEKVRAAEQSSAAEVGHLQGKLNAAQDELRTASLRLEGEDAGGPSQLSKAKKEIRALKAECNNLKVQLQEATAREAGAAAAPPDCEQRTEQLAELEAKLEAAKEQMSMMQSALTVAAERIKSAKDAEERMEAELNERSNEAADLRRRTAELEGKLKVLDHLEEETESLRSRLEAARAAEEQAKESASSAWAEVKVGQQRAAALEAKLEKTADVGNAFEEEQLAKMAELDAAKAELNKQLRKAEEAAVAAKQKMMAVELREQEAAGREAEAAERVATAQAEARRVAAEADGRAKRFAHVQAMFSKKESAFGERLAAAQEEARLAAQRSEEAVANAAQALERLCAAEGRESELAKAVERVEETNARMALQVSAAEEELAAAQAVASQVDLAKKQAADAEAHAELLSSELEDLEGKNVVLAMQVEVAEVSAAKTESRVRALQEKVDFADKEVEILRAENAQKLSVGGSIQKGGEGEAEREEESEGGDPPQVAVPVDTGENIEEEVQDLVEENRALKARVANVESRISASVASHIARIATLEKTNRQLSWQVAMMANSPGGGQAGSSASPATLEDGLPRPQPSARSPSGGRPEPSATSPGVTVAAVVGWVLAHRKILVAGYLVVLHLMVYFALTHGAFSFSSYGKTFCNDSPPPAAMRSVPAGAKLSPAPLPDLQPPATV